MKNIALCFNRARGRGGIGGTTNAAALTDLMRSHNGQIVWCPTGVGESRRKRLRDDRIGACEAHAAIAEAYEFLVAEWTPGDRLFLLGVGRGAACARALARLLGTVGVLNEDVPGWTAEDFRAYVLSTYVAPRTRRDDTDWEHIGRLAAELSGRDVAVDVQFLGLWDTAALPGWPRTGAARVLANVVAARHAVAIDGGTRSAQLLGECGEAVEEVWFRGAHCDVTGGHNACPPLSDIALDWVLDGAVAAGAHVSPSPQRTSPNAVDAMAGSHTVSLRKVPVDATVHASVEIYLRAHPSYWRRLPARLRWADPDWAARSERLVPGSPSNPQAPPPATENPALVAVPELLPG